MKFNRLALAWRILLVILVIYALITWWRQSAPPPNIRIGVLHSLTGTMASSEKPLVDALQMAIEEANAAGGIKGQKIEAVVVDCRSDATYCAQQAERLITEEKVSALFGCWTSACRKAVKPVVEKRSNLLFYPMQYEGMEISPNIIYTGAAPNQQIIPGVSWALEKLGKRVYLVGSDYVFPRMANIIIKDLLAAQGGVLTGERYLPLGESAMEAVVADIARQRPDVVLNTLNGDSNGHFFAALEKTGLNNLPLVSFSVGASEMKDWGGSRLGQHYGVWSYFQFLPGERNRRFVAAFQARFGADRIISDPMEAAYIGLHLWVQAAREAGSAEPAKVQFTILRQTLTAPEGMVAIDRDNRHLWKTPRIGKVRPDGQFDIVWDAGQAQEPVPFPSYRSRDEWLQLLQSIEGAQP
ncbi:MAG: ABC transporter substrate-binding protein [Gammaproteobacteria bacterium]|nr:ABC transporter substrate-binding protein [Gammaproteobacteria bacterium]MBU1978995.1 ABC transporter substrate-binding protein [Gammaproteobacteria bacterium]